MPKQPKDADAEILQEVIRAIVKGMGRGGLTYVASRLGMTPSAFRKRLKSEQAFDVVSLRASLLVLELRETDTDTQPSTQKKVGRYIVSRHEDGDGVRPTWRVGRRPSA